MSRGLRDSTLTRGAALLGPDLRGPEAIAGLEAADDDNGCEADCGDDGDVATDRGRFLGGGETGRVTECSIAPFIRCWGEALPF
jgi:hypothetical protein